MTLGGWINYWRVVNHGGEASYKEGRAVGQTSPRARLHWVRAICFPQPHRRRACWSSVSQGF